jgi:acyl carrier protein
MTEAKMGQTTGKKVDRAEILAVIDSVIDKLNEQMPHGRRIEKDGSTVLFGRDGLLDSLQLVRLVVGTEQAVNEAFGATIVLATEAAMSRERSPFRTVDSLVDFIAESLHEQAHD